MELKLSTISPLTISHETVDGRDCFYVRHERISGDGCSLDYAWHNEAIYDEHSCDVALNKREVSIINEWHEAFVG